MPIMRKHEGTNVITEPGRTCFGGELVTDRPASFHARLPGAVAQNRRRRSSVATSWTSGLHSPTTRCRRSRRSAESITWLPMSRRLLSRRET